MDELLWIASLAASTLRIATPLLFAAMAGFFSERAGIVDIGLEGKMLMAAFAAAAAAAVTGSPWIGLAAAVASSSLLALLHGYATITQRGDQVISGVAINLLAPGLTVLLANAWFELGRETPALSGTERFQPVFGVPLLVYAAYLAVPLAWWLAYRTRFGLRLRAVGENPEAAETAGVRVAAVRYRAVLLAGLLCGFAGAYLSVAQGNQFQAGMTAGKGYLALAALIVGKWRPVPTLLACLMFAAADALQARLQGVPILGITVPVQLIEALPYLITVLLLAGFLGRAIPPRAIGKPYPAER